MKTESYISTISYNSEEHLARVLGKLVDQGTLAWWAFIFHKGEKDRFEPEKRDKDHRHLVLKPARAVDSNTIGAALDEFDPEHPDKPLGATIWKRTKYPWDWILYSRHDAVYLEYKGETKEFLDYPWEDFRTSDWDIFRKLRAEAPEFAPKSYRAAKSALGDGKSPEAILEAINPSLGQARMFRESLSELIANKGRVTIQFDPKTGQPIGLDHLKAYPAIKRALASREVRELINARLCIQDNTDPRTGEINLPFMDEPQAEQLRLDPDDEIVELPFPD